MARRDESIIPLSREHHYGLLLSLKLRRGLAHSERSADRVVRRVSDVEAFFTGDLQNHFRADLTPNHGHAAMVGVFGMLAMALLTFSLRQVVTDEWVRPEKYIRLSFWGLNVGLALMVMLNLFPGGMLQLLDVLENGCWHARSAAFLNQPIMRAIEWLRLPADLIFIGAGVISILMATVLVYRIVRRTPMVSAAIPHPSYQPATRP